MDSESLAAAAAVPTAILGGSSDAAFAMAEGLTVGALAVAKEFPVIGGAFKCLKDLHDIYRDVSDQDDTCLRVVRWSSNIMSVLERVGKHYSGQQQKGRPITQSQLNTVNDITVALRRFVGKTKKQS